MTTNPVDAWMVDDRGGLVPFAFEEDGRIGVNACASEGLPLAVSLESTVAGPFYFLIDYESTRNHQLVITAGLGDDLVEPSGLAPIFAADQGEGQVLAFVRGGAAVDRIGVSSDGEGFCVSSIGVGRLAH